MCIYISREIIDKIMIQIKKAGQRLYLPEQKDYKTIAMDMFIEECSQSEKPLVRSVVLDEFIKECSLSFVCNPEIALKMKSRLQIINSDEGRLAEGVYMSSVEKVKFTVYSQEKLQLPENAAGLFDGIKLKSIDLGEIDTSETVNMSGMFSNCSLKELNLSNFNTSKVEDISRMFRNCEILELDLSKFDISHVKRIFGIFNRCKIENVIFAERGQSRIRKCYEKFQHENHIYYDEEVVDLMPAMNISALLQNNRLNIERLKENSDKLRQSINMKARVVGDWLGLFPPEVSDDLALEEEYDRVGKEKKVTVLINALDSTGKSILVANKTSGLIFDLKEKTQFDSFCDGKATVAAMTNISLEREILEANIGLKNLYVDVRELETLYDGEDEAETEKIKSELNEDYNGTCKISVKVLGNFKDCNISLLNNYLLNKEFGKSLELFMAGHRKVLIVNEALEANTQLRKNFDVCLLSYYGAINTEDTCSYTKDELMSVKQLLLILGKVVGSNRNAEEILKNSDLCGLDLEDHMDIYYAIKLISKNFGVWAESLFNDMLEQNYDPQLRNPEYFKNIVADLAGDTEKILLWYYMGLIPSENQKNANLPECLTMEAVVSLIFQILQVMRKSLHDGN